MSESLIANSRAHVILSKEYNIEFANFAKSIKDEIHMEEFKLLCDYYIQEDLRDKFFIRFYHTLIYMQKNENRHFSWKSFFTTEMDCTFASLEVAFGLINDYDNDSEDLYIEIQNKIVTKNDFKTIVLNCFGHIGNGKQNNPYGLTTLGYDVLHYMYDNIPEYQLTLLNYKGKGAKATLFPTGNKRGRKITRSSDTISNCIKSDEIYQSQKISSNVTLVQGTLSFYNTNFNYFGDKTENDNTQIKTLKLTFKCYLQFASNLEVDTKPFIKSLPESSSIVGYIGLIITEINNITKDTY